MASTPTFVGSGSDYSESQPWYANKTLWIVGGVGLVIVVFFYVSSQQSSSGSGSTVTTTPSGSATGTNSANLLAAMEQLQTNDQQILQSLQQGQTNPNPTPTPTPTPTSVPGMIPAPLPAQVTEGSSGYGLGGAAWNTSYTIDGYTHLTAAQYAALPKGTQTYYEPQPGVFKPTPAGFQGLVGKTPLYTKNTYTPQQMPTAAPGSRLIL